MNRLWRKNIVRWFLLIFLDIFLVSELEFTPWVKPHIYLLFILLLPVRVSKTGLLLLGFISGFTMDVFLDTGGIHAFAATMMAFVRIFFVPIFTSAEDYEDNITPGLRQFGFFGFLLYSGVLVLIYNLTFFSLEIFKSSFWLLIAGKTILSTLTTLVLLFLIEVAFHPKKAES